MPGLIRFRRTLTAASLFDQSLQNNRFKSVVHHSISENGSALGVRDVIPTNMDQEGSFKSTGAFEKSSLHRITHFVKPRKIKKMKNIEKHKRMLKLLSRFANINF